MDTFGLHLHQCTFNENETVLQDLIKTGKDLNQRDERGETAIHVAAKFNKVNALKILLVGCATFKAVNKEKRNILHIAIENNSFACVYLLLQLDECSNIINKIDCHGLSPLMIAIEKKEKTDMSLRHEQQKLTELLINHRFIGDVFQEIYSSSKRKYDTHFQCAIQCENEFAIDCMIKKAQEYSFESLITCPSFVDLIKLRPETVNLRNKMHQSPLHEAVVCKNFELIEMLLRNNADCNSRDVQLRTPLYIAAGHYNQCCRRNNLKPCVDFEIFEKCTQLREIYSITSKSLIDKCVHLAVIVYLVSQGNADIFVENSKGEKLIDYFVDDEDICDYLLSAAIKNIQTNRCQIPANYYLENAYNVFGARMKNYETSNNSEISSFEAIHKRENISLELFLCEQSDGQNPIDFCVDQQTFNCYFLRLQQKYKALIIYNEQQQMYLNIERALDYLGGKAQFWNSFHFESGFEQCEEYGNEMIHDACSRNDVNLLRNALKILKPYEISETNDNGENALHVAVKHASLECIKFLLFENVNYPNICDYQHNTQMDYALSLCLHSTSIMRNRRAQIVAYLLELIDGETQTNSTGMVRRNLLPNSVDHLPVNHFNSLRLFSIYFAAFYGRSEIIVAIFQRERFLDLEDNVVCEWLTASVISAARNKYVHIIELLIFKIVSYGNIGIKLLETCFEDIISCYDSICCLRCKKCDLICVLQKCVKLKQIFMRTSVILPHPFSKCGVPALIVFLIEVGCISIREQQFKRLVNFQSSHWRNLPMYRLLFDYYDFVYKSKINNKVFKNVLDEKHAFNNLHKIENNGKQKNCCVQ